MDNMVEAVGESGRCEGQHGGCRPQCLQTMHGCKWWCCWGKDGGATGSFVGGRHVLAGCDKQKSTEGEREGVQSADALALKYAQVGERIGGYYSIIKAKSRS
jgi:hypothetical protein